MATVGPGPVLPCHSARSWRRAAGSAEGQHHCRGNKGSTGAAWKGEGRKKTRGKRGKEQRREVVKETKRQNKGK